MCNYILSSQTLEMEKDKQLHFLDRGPFRIPVFNGDFVVKDIKNDVHKGGDQVE